MFKWLKNVDKRLLLFIGVFIGVVLTAGSSAALHATDTDEFCSSCHVMSTAYNTFKDSTHAHLECNDCHAPSDSLTRKIIFKARAGFHDIYMNTFNADEIPEVFHVTEASRQVINENCISCHQSTITNVAHDAKEDCSDCHRYVPHGKGNTNFE